MLKMVYNETILDKQFKTFKLLEFYRTKKIHNFKMNVMRGNIVQCNKLHSFF